MSLDERLAALREDDDTMNNTPPMSRRSSFLGSLSRRSRTSSIASDPGLSRRSSESIAPALTRQRSATESELLPGRRHLIEVKHEWVPSEKWLPSIGVSVADRRLAIAFERRRSSSGRSRTTVSLDGRLALLLLFLTLIPAATGLAVLGGARPAAAATRAAVASRAPAPNFFLNDAPRPLVDGLRRAHDATIEEQFQQDFAAELPTYPPPAASVAALDDATRYLPVEERRAVDSALDYAARAHEGQRRKSGEAYVTHPIAVAVLLAEQRMDVDTIVAGLLHDTVEDTSVTVRPPPLSLPSPIPPPLALTPRPSPHSSTTSATPSAPPWRRSSPASPTASPARRSRRARRRATRRRRRRARRRSTPNTRGSCFSRWRRSGASSW